MKLQLLLSAILLITIAGCNTKPNASAIVKKEGEWVWNNQHISDVMVKRKSKDIEKEVLAKVAEIQYESSGGIIDVFCAQELQMDSCELLEVSSLALGNDTLTFIKKFKINDKVKFFKTQLAPIIKKHLRLIALVRDYQPHNGLETEIIEQIKEYPPVSADGYWPTEKNSMLYEHFNVEPFHNFKLHEYKIGPLADNKYIYVKIYEENGSIEYAGISDSEKGRDRTIFSYRIDYKYPSMQ